MKKYVVSSAVVTTPGRYTYVLIKPDEARLWWTNQVISTIGYEETAAALSELLGLKVGVNRRTIAMESGDEALVFRLVFPPGTPRINPKDKGALGRAIINGHYELGLLIKE